MWTWKLVRELFPYPKDLTFTTPRGAGTTTKKVIGRNQADIVCESVFVSRHHCSVIYKNGVFYIRDGDGEHLSTNGTFLNGKMIPPKLERELRNDDMIGIGVANMTETPTKEYFVFRFILSNQVEDRPAAKANAVKKDILLITLDDEEDESGLPNGTTGGGQEISVGSKSTIAIPKSVKKGKMDTGPVSRSLIPPQKAGVSAPESSRTDLVKSETDLPDVNRPECSNKLDETLRRNREKTVVRVKGYDRFQQFQMEDNDSQDKESSYTESNEQGKLKPRKTSQVKQSEIKKELIRTTREEIITHSSDSRAQVDDFVHLRRLGKRLHEDFKRERMNEVIPRIDSTYSISTATGQVSGGIDCGISGGSTNSSPKGQKRRVPESEPSVRKVQVEPDAKRVRVSNSPPTPGPSTGVHSAYLTTSATFKKPAIPCSPKLLSSSGNTTLDAVKARILNKTMTPRHAIKLDHSPGHASNHSSATSRFAFEAPRKKTSVVNPFHVRGFSNSAELFDKLKESGELEGHSSVRPAVQVKLTSNNRTEKFAKSLQNKNSQVKSDIVQRRLENLEEKLPASNPAEAAHMPVMQIIQEMSKTKDAAPIAQPVHKPERPKLNAEVYRNRMQKTGYQVSPAKASASVPVPIRTETSGALADDKAESVPPDDVYRNVLEWNTHWLGEQHAQKTKISPPVYGSRKLVTNLPGFRDYESYINTFYPLMLLELWAGIYQDYYRPNKNRPGNGDRSGGRCNFQVSVEKVDIRDHCPLLPPLEKSERRKNMINLNTKSTPFWHCIKLMTLTATKDLNKTNDFGILEVDIMKVNGHGAGVKTKRSVFGFFLSESELYEEINSAMSDQSKLFPQDLQYKYKYSVTFVTHLKEHQDIVRINLGTVQRFSYISSKIRDFRAISLLPSSRLFDRVIHPAPEASEVYEPNSSISVAGLVKDVVDLLNPIQKGVVQHISSRILTRDDSDLLLIHGPPGTGKTRTIVGLVLQLLKANPGKNAPKQKLLLCTPSNTAIDELIRRLSEALGDTFRMVRIGQGCPEVKKFQLDELSKKHCSGASQLESIREAVKSTNLKIIQLQDKLAELNKSPEETVAAGALRSEIESLRNKRHLYVADLDRTRNDRKALDRAKIDVLLSADVVCSTLSSCCNSFVKKHLGPRKNNRSAPPVFTCCIIDEATQATEPESLSPLMLNCEKLILVGDPMQLPATVLSTEAESRDFGQSLFTRLYNLYQTSANNPVMMLTQQYRMSEAILQWPNLRFYQNKLTTSTAVKSDPRRILRLHPYLFLNIHSQENNDNRQFSNMLEVRLIKEILLTIKRQSSLHPNHASLTIGIITPYSEQRTKLLRLLDEFKEIDRSDSSTFSSSIEVDTVDSFQGREKDIVLLSCVRTEELGFLKTPQRLNVSLTRARMCLFVIGNAACLNANEMWKSLMDDAARRQLYRTIPNDDPVRPDRYRQAVEKCLLLPTK